MISQSSRKSTNSTKKIHSINSGSKLGQALKKCNYSSRASVYALAKGYNVIDAGNGYYSVLNRNAVTMSQNVNAI